MIPRPYPFLKSLDISLVLSICVCICIWSSECVFVFLFVFVFYPLNVYIYALRQHEIYLSMFVNACASAECQTSKIILKRQKENFYFTTFPFFPSCLLSQPHKMVTVLFRSLCLRRTKKKLSQSGKFLKVGLPKKESIFWRYSKEKMFTICETGKIVTINVKCRQWMGRCISFHINYQQDS